MKVRRAVADDIQAIYEVEKDSFSSPWSLASITLDVKENSKAYYLVIEDEQKEIIGYAGSWIVVDEGQITNIAIKKKYRQQGYGSILVHRLIKDLCDEDVREIFLEVRKSNDAALALYHRLGFEIKGLRKDYYQDPLEDGYIMSLLVSKEEK